MKTSKEAINQFDKEIKAILLKYVDEIDYGQFAAQFIKFGTSLAFGVSNSREEAISLMNKAIKAGLEQFEEISSEIMEKY